MKQLNHLNTFKMSGKTFETKLDKKISKFAESFQLFRIEREKILDREKTINQEKINIVLDKLLIFLDSYIKRICSTSEKSSFCGFFIVEDNKVFCVTESFLRTERGYHYGILSNSGKLRATQYKNQYNEVNFIENVNVFVGDETIPITTSYTKQLYDIIVKYLTSCDILIDMKSEDISDYYSGYKLLNQTIGFMC